MKQNKGFSLMELLIVIGLIGILIAIASVSYSSAQKKSRDSRRMSDLKNIQNALEQYYADHSGSYPTATDGLTTYLPSGWPLDPRTGVAYTSSLAANAFCVCTTLEGTTTGGNASNTSCTFTTGGAYFCIKNQQ